ncbi:hypothetical protein ACO34A_05075 [Rhizobium sp. ACO-34A]|nr:hypothetical protein [Rhizobium sp. ACO-34A]ATN33174.1 hypothetical protein ACO34A_05075 [Rhizobium sp. ACO-34A]
MISVFAGQESGFAAEVIFSALERSVSAGLVNRALSADKAITDGIYVFISPDETQASLIAAAVAGRSKVLIFGAIPPTIAPLCGLMSVSPLSTNWVEAAACEPTPIYQTTRSSAEVRWSGHPLASASPFATRPFLRFDYADEWNNLGFGRITADGGLWSIAVEAEVGGADVLAWAARDEVAAPTSFVTLSETATSSVLWWNRAAGAVDSAEWAVIEAFLSDWRPGDRPCVPVISEIPWGYDTAITMRLDCDEDIASARPLFELYRERNLPFSVAIKTAQEDRDDHVVLLKEILAADGAVLSHSVTHAPRWGGSQEACRLEARGSSDWLEERLPGFTVRYAVSPFHQNPAYVPAGLKQAGLEGFVGGIIANDPEMLLARGGVIPGDDTGLVTHSQQCMMHGDCILNEGDPIAITKQAFVNACQTETLFGYLDHPFSPRYDYGWGSEEHRVARHADFLDFIAAETADKKVAWMNEDTALDWIAAKSHLRLEKSPSGFSQTAGAAEVEDYAFAVRFQGARKALTELLHD